MIANRYYNTTERMTGLFGKITDQMIVNCKECITGKDSMDALWEKVWNIKNIVLQLSLRVGTRAAGGL